jgi:hypothetical protein
MSIVRFKLDVDGLAAIPPSVRRNVFRDAIGDAGDWWWTNRLPLHFTNQAYAIWGYTRRQPGYERAKRQRRANGNGVRAIGEVKPNVWSGESRERSRTKDVRPKAASSTRCHVDVVINAPALNFKNPKSAVNPRAEVTALTESERLKAQDVFQSSAIRRFEAAGHNHRISKIIAA